jgi:GTP-binding protein HflX
VRTVLTELGRTADADNPFVEVLNKIDRLPADAQEALLARASRDPDTVALSAISGEGCDRLLAEIDRRLAATRETVEYDLPFGDGASIAWLHAHGHVIESRSEGDTLHVVVSLDPADRARFDHRRAREP